MEDIGQLALSPRLRPSSPLSLPPLVTVMGCAQNNVSISEEVDVSITQSQPKEVNALPNILEGVAVSGYAKRDLDELKANGDLSKIGGAYEGRVRGREGERERDERERRGKRRRRESGE